MKNFKNTRVSNVKFIAVTFHPCIVTAKNTKTTNWNRSFFTRELGSTCILSRERTYFAESFKNMSYLKSKLAYPSCARYELSFNVFIFNYYSCEDEEHVDVKVLNIDNSDVVVLPQNCFFQMDKEGIELPMQCVCCSLADVSNLSENSSNFRSDKVLVVDLVNCSLENMQIDSSGTNRGTLLTYITTFDLRSYIHGYVILIKSRW